MCGVRLLACASLSCPRLAREAYTAESVDRQLARATFEAYERAHPSDPLGPAAQAASYLYQELYAQGVFTSEFFLDDKELLGGDTRPPDPARQSGFLAKNRKATAMAEKLLGKNPKDAHALFVLTITEGMQADYLSLVEKRRFESLRYVRRAERDAKRLLATDPRAQDPCLALGAAHYILGCLPGYKRFFLRLGGIGGDRARGLAELQLAAAHGHFLRPLAQSFLALAALREKQPALARARFEKLSGEFPDHPVFARALGRLQPSPAPAPASPRRGFARAIYIVAVLLYGQGFGG